MLTPQLELRCSDSLLAFKSCETTIVSSATKYSVHSLPPSDIRSSDKYLSVFTSDNILDKHYASMNVPGRYEVSYLVIVRIIRKYCHA